LLCRGSGFDAITRLEVGSALVAIPAYTYTIIIYKEQVKMPDTRLHLKPEVTVGHIVTTIALILSLVTMYSASKDDRAHLDTKIALLEQASARQELAMKSLKSTIDVRLDRMDTKLDRLLEHMLASKELQK